MLETMPDGILATDEEGRITSWNETFVEISRTPEELIALQDIQKSERSSPLSTL